MFELQALASRVLVNVLGGHTLPQSLARLSPPDLPPRERAMVQDLSFGTVRHFERLSAVLAPLVAKPLKDSAVRALLLVALYQLIYSKDSPHAVVNEAVKAVVTLKKTSAKGLVNAVLRNFLRQREALLEKAVQSSPEARFEHPQWWIDKVQSQYPAEWQAILASNLTHPPMTLRVNARQARVADYLDQLAAAGLQAEPLGGQAIRLRQPVPVDRLPAFLQGDVSVQDRGAQYAAELLGAQDGMRVLDACAAPGGKTAHLLERAALDLTALDNDGSRLARVQQNLDRLHLQARLVVNDAAAVADWWDGVPYDCILADVPCSASGVVRRHPDIKRLRRPQDIAQFAATQQKILGALWQCLAQGGKLLYVTCSVFAEENQLQIKAHLARYPDARLLPLPGLSDHDKQLLPNDQHDGFYYALLQKEGRAA